ncbi:hypothetical protein CMEL01_04670, partial [Colletotrichum melonis]
LLARLAAYISLEICSRSLNTSLAPQLADSGPLVKDWTFDSLRIRCGALLRLPRGYAALDRPDTQFQDGQSCRRKQGHDEVDREVSWCRRVGDGSVGRNCRLQRLVRTQAINRDIEIETTPVYPFSNESRPPFSMTI